MDSASNPHKASQRAREKQESRDRDQARLGAGEVSAADLRCENGIGSRLPLGRYEISAIGGQAIKRS